MRAKFSQEKVEKVVKPPQIPVARNNLYSSVNQSNLSGSVRNIPMRKHPMIFTKKVEYGNGLLIHPVNDLLTKYRNALPIPPPRKTKITSFIFYLENQFYLMRIDYQDIVLISD